MIEVNGVAAASPSVFKAEREEMGGSVERAASGKAVLDAGGFKWLLNLKWARLSDTERAALLGAAEAGTFTAKFPNPKGAGTAQGTFYCRKYSLGIAIIRNGETVWTDVAMEWEEA